MDNPLENVQRIAKFIFDGTADDIQNNPEKVLNISKYGYDEILDRIKIENTRKDVINNPQSFELGAENFFRKGINNDWKNYFNEQQSELIDEIYASDTLNYLARATQSKNQ